MPCNMKIKTLKFKLLIPERFKMTFCSLKKSGSMMLLDLSFDRMVRKEGRSHWVSVFKHNLCVVRFFTLKIE